MIRFLFSEAQCETQTSLQLDIAKKCGADIVLNPSKVNLYKEIMGLTENLGCDVYIEATGAGSSVRQGLNVIARLGRFVEFSVFGKDVTCDWSIIGKKKSLSKLVSG